MDPAIFIIGALVLVGAIVAGAVAADRAGRRRMAQALGTIGLRSLSDPTREEKESAFSRMGRMRDLRRGASGVKWAAMGTASGREVCVLQHRYTVQAGKSSHTVVHTIAATPVPASWPDLTLAAERWYHRLGDLLGGKDIQLEDAAFNAKWRVRSPDAEFAMVLLSPRTQAACMSLPGWAQVRCGQGALCVFRQGGLKPDAAVALVGSLVELRNAIPPELDAWT